MHLNLSADEVLSTTRAVRKRLDFDKPVEREVIEECLQLALQAPTGSNSQGWQWLFVTDPAKKKALADIYVRNFEIYRKFGGPGLSEDDPRAAQQERVVDSAQYLADNFHKVPVMMIPCITG
ncbi:MAG: nitroreductase family protein, partial [Ilumatobacteraceae bacterium]